MFLAPFAALSRPNIWPKMGFLKVSENIIKIEIVIGYLWMRWVVHKTGVCWPIYGHSLLILVLSSFLCSLISLLSPNSLPLFSSSLLKANTSLTASAAYILLAESYVTFHPSPLTASANENFSLTVLLYLQSQLMQMLSLPSLHPNTSLTFLLTIPHSSLKHSSQSVWKLFHMAGQIAIHWLMLTNN